ncbi:MAG: cyclic peptide export ABC transporter [Cyanobacteria bacterium J06560_2]
MKIFWFVAKRAPWLTVLALVTAGLSGLCSGGLIALVHRSLSATALSSPEVGSVPLVGLFLGVVVMTLLSAIAANLVIAYLYRKILLNLQVQLARTLINAPLRKLEKMGSAPLLALLTEDIDNISETATELVPLVTDVITIVVCFGYLIWLSWQAFLATLVFLLIGGISYQLMIRHEQDILTISREQLDTLYRYFSDLTLGIKELKLNSNRSEAFLRETLRPTARAVQKSLFRWDAAYTVISAWGRFLILMVVGLILFLLPRYLTIETEILSGYVIALLYVRASILSVIDVLPELSEAAVALRKIESVGLDLAAEATPVAETSAPVTVWRSLQLKAVTHRYYREREDSFFTLGPIDLTFQSGELVFLVGGNGSGKTTLAKLIMGLYEPETGEILLDGMPVSSEPSRALIDQSSVERHSFEQYRQLFSAIFTDFHLFDQLLGMGDQGPNEQIDRYLDRLQLGHKLSIDSGRFSTTALSRGQQQRLALLVAYLEDRPFYVFDEWASNQDPVFKNVFYTEFLPELKAKGKTVLVISHDDRYFQVGDRLLKLTDGQLS